MAAAALLWRLLAGFHTSCSACCASGSTSSLTRRGVSSSSASPGPEEALMP